MFMQSPPRGVFPSFCPTSWSAPYQLDFLTPGNWPSRANRRKQMRHMPNMRIYARGRPQMRQRFFCRTGYLGGRRDLTIFDTFATATPLIPAEGHAHQLEQSLAFLVGPRRRHYYHLQAANAVYLVVFDLGEDQLLTQAETVVAAPVEALV